VDRGRCGRDSTARIIEVDNFNAQGELPQSLGQVMQRAKDIQYASKTRFNIERIQEIGQLRAAAGRLVGRLPPELRSDPDAQNWLPPVTREAT
jgi:NTE family protein